MTTPKLFDLNRLFDGWLQVLRTESEHFSRLTDHKSELGRLNEGHFVKLLRTYLPSKIGVGTGFIVSGGSSPRQSPQCDIILYDAVNNAPLYESEAWSIYPIEIVYGVIEIKTNLNRSALKDAFNKCAVIRGMAKVGGGKGNKGYWVPSAKPLYYQSNLAPRFFLFGYNGWNREVSFARNFKEATEINETAHIHGLCSLHQGGSFFIHHIPFQTGEDRFSSVYHDGFRRFLMSLPSLLDSMLLPHRIGLGFDLVDISRYLPIP
jgi:hypothetical protein